MIEERTSVEHSVSNCSSSSEVRWKKKKNPQQAYRCNFFFRKIKTKMKALRNLVNSLEINHYLGKGSDKHPLQDYNSDPEGDEALTVSLSDVV